MFCTSFFQLSKPRQGDSDSKPSSIVTYEKLHEMIHQQRDSKMSEEVLASYVRDEQEDGECTEQD